MELRKLPSMLVAAVVTAFVCLFFSSFCHRTALTLGRYIAYGIPYR